jgi:hypothetical protein
VKVGTVPSGPLKELEAFKPGRGPASDLLRLIYCDVGRRGGSMTRQFGMFDVESGAGLSKKGDDLKSDTPSA